jgi:phospholipid transport system substrate-binding protein
VLRRSLLTTVMILIAGALPPGLPAKAGMDPAVFINNLSNRLQAVTSNTSPEQKLAGFHELFRAEFDVPGLGRFVLGRFWRIFTPSEQQEFLGLFENYVVLSYSERLLEYAGNGGGLRVTGSRPDPDGAIVSSEITRGSGQLQTVQPIKVDWRLSGRDGMYKISDVIIDGLSMAANGRSQLEGVVERNAGQAQSYSRRNAATGRKRFCSLDHDRASARALLRIPGKRPSRGSTPVLRGGGLGLFSFARRIFR